MRSEHDIYTRGRRDTIMSSTSQCCLFPCNDKKSCRECASFRKVAVGQENSVVEFSDRWITCFCKRRDMSRRKITREKKKYDSEIKIQAIMKSNQDRIVQVNILHNKLVISMKLG